MKILTILHLIFLSLYVQAFSKECVPKHNFLNSQPKHILWVLKRSVGSFGHPKHMLKLIDKKNINNFTLKYFAYLNL